MQNATATLERPGSSSAVKHRVAPLLRNSTTNYNKCPYENFYMGQVWWCMSLIQVFRRQKHEDHKFKAHLGYLASLKPAKIQSENLSQKQTQNPKNRAGTL